MKGLTKREFGVAIVLLATIVIVQFVSGRFLSPANLRDLMVQAAPFAIMACGMTLVLLVGEVDISIGSLGGTLAAILGLSSSSTHWGLPLPVSALIVCGAGAAVGLLSGLLVTGLGVPSIIATLSLLTVLRGVTQALLGGVWITDLPPALRHFGTGTVAGMPVPVLVAVVVVVLSAVALSSTPFGRRVYAVGSNPAAAEIRGLSVRGVKVLAFVLMGLLTGVAVLVSAPQLAVIESGFGSGWELFVITCVVVGGVSIQGGRGSIIGALLGVLLLSIIRTVLIFLKLGDQATYWERSIQGAFILIATFADRFEWSRRKRGATA